MVAGHELSTFEVHDPATGRSVGSYPVHSAADVDAAVATAHNAGAWWAALGFTERRRRVDAWRAEITRGLSNAGHTCLAVERVYVHASRNSLTRKPRRTNGSRRRWRSPRSLVAPRSTPSSTGSFRCYMEGPADHGY
ncbi:aldehyde dehydrogenase family protein [Nocardia sp. NPDC057440]|uniref:aldehyde dehydrogenase family protein n=1 Tax=Nocardia sp. NPDC057440 TaxID=3346134 RepID=UPI00366A8320